ncbi:MAG: carboxypeptidase-like regulatory domain-containing protein [Planctomycetes bacterium]|nr:carboxypeptidase-like regulatory domain-containing protein [Planctomycetota bacterium]
MHRGARCEFTVADDAGKPVEGAVLRQLTYIGDHSLVSGRAISDEVGRAQLAVVGAREEVLVEAAGFAREWVSAREEDSGPDPIRVVLHEGRALAGTVADAEGRPLRGVLVSLHDQRVLTADDGRFAFDGLEARVQDFVDDGLWVKAHLAGWCGGEHVNVWPGDLEVRVVLRRTATVRGVVVHADGKPAVGARVNSDFTTDEAGRFELLQFASGHELVWADARAPADARTRVHGAEYADAPPGGTVENLRIVLEPDASECFVLVRTMDADGKPIAMSEVLAFDGDHCVADNRTGDDGTILLRIRDRDGARVRIAANTWRPPWLDAVAEKLVEARSAPPFETVELRLGPPGRLRLRAVDPDGNDVPIDGVHVSAGRADVRGTDGTWDLPATRTFSATVLVPGFAVRTVELAPPHPRFREEVIRLVPATHVVGRVVGRDGEPDARDLTIVIAVRDAATGVWERATAQVAKDGRVEFTTLPPGPAHVWVLGGDDVTLAFSAVDVAAGRTTDVGDLALAGPTPFRGLVVDETGRGIGGALAIFEDAAGDSACRPVCTRPDGTFDVTLPGRFAMRLRVTRPRPRHGVRRVGVGARADVSRVTVPRGSRPAGPRVCSCGVRTRTRVPVDRDARPGHDVDLARAGRR